jgi:hypothetical protein
MCATSLTPPSTGLSGTAFSTLNSAGINDPEEPEKHSIKILFSKLFTLSAIFGDLRGGYNNITIIPKNTRVEG